MSRSPVSSAEQTSTEDTLWQILRGRRLDGLKWRRQFPLPAIADFCCLEVGLTIELDGEQHLEQIAADAARRAAIEHHGYWSSASPTMR